MSRMSSPLRTVSSSDIGFAFTAMRESVDALRAMLMTSTLPVWVHPLSDNPLQSAVDRLCRLWIQDALGSPKAAFLNQTLPVRLDINDDGHCECGIICVDNAVFEQVARVNANKATFRKLCETMAKEELAINGATKRVKTSVSDERKRNTALANSFKSMGISQLNLRWCYNQIHTIDRPIYRIGFTWQRSHADRKRLTRDEAIQYSKRTLNSVSDHDLVDWENQLLSYPHDAIFVRIKEKLDQQRANYVISRGGYNNTIVTPGVVVMRSDSLPAKYNAKTKEQMGQRSGERIDAIFNSQTDLGFRGLHILPKELWAAEHNKRRGKQQ